MTRAEKEAELDREIIIPRPKGPVKLTPFQKQQREKLQSLRDLILDSMAGVAKDTLRSRPEGSEASAFGMHQADAGSDAYDKDFALSLLSQEQDALYEIEEAIKRIDAGTYGICEMSGKPIMIARLEALPFARYTVECQAELERTKRHQRARVPVTSLFGLTDSDEEETDNEESEDSPQKPQTEE
jgi:RNA polymerase-binding transcription factor DksA